MRTILLLSVALILLAACAPTLPDGLNAEIHRVYPDAKILEVKRGTGGQWCVAYQPDPDQKPVIMQVFYDSTWIPVNEAWAYQISLVDNKPEGGWCQVPGHNFE